MTGSSALSQAPAAAGAPPTSGEALDGLRTSLRGRSQQLREERILAAARQILRDGCEDRLTVDRIARGANVSPRTVFNLLGTRDQLWARLARDVFGRVELGAVSGPANGWSRIGAVVEALMRAVLADPAVSRAVLGHGQCVVYVVDEWLADSRIADLTDVTGEGTRLSHVPPSRLVGVFTAGLVGLLEQWSRGLIPDSELCCRGADLVEITATAVTSDENDRCPPNRWRTRPERSVGGMFPA